MDYLSTLQYIAAVDQEDKIIEKVERWKAHKQGILHRAFTLTITYEDQLLLQHRKHPVFDGVYDVTISSHPIYNGNQLEDMEDALYRTLQREWNIKIKDLVAAPSFKGAFYYQASDPRSDYQEHEVCHVYTCQLKVLSLPNLDTAYGFSLQDINQIRNKDNLLYPLLAPWVQKMITQNLL